MTAGWQKVEELFEQAVERPAQERGAWLQKACEGDESLYRSVEVLLEADRRADGFLEGVVAEGARLVERFPAMTDRRVGPYRLKRRLGRGGMGEVYLASRDDQEYEKTVAVKLVRPGLDTARVLERFRRERQILANLEHPHIARLLDGGTTEEGEPYFVMEHVEGEPLDTYCDRHQLGLTQRLELFATVCSAVQIAHQNLVVHRDLKPSNILVSADGTVKLLDFGIAKLLAEDEVAADLTSTLERPLTLAYASPEQIRGEPIAPASDVYALGCLLYELLTGCRPFDLAEATRREAERRILEEDPPAPSGRFAAWHREERAAALVAARARGLRPETLRRRLAGELDTIVLGTLRKERARRPGSAAELAADVRRFLGGLPIRAHRDTWGYHALKFAVRHRAALTVLGLFIAILTAAFLNSLHQRREVVRERDKAVVVRDFLVGLFDDFDDSRARGEPVTARELLDRGVAQIEDSFAGPEPSGEPPLALVVLTDTLGRIYPKLGLHERVRPLVEQALRIRRERLGDRHPDVAQSLYALARIERAAGRYEAAEGALREALEIYREGPETERSRIAETVNDLGLVLRRQGRYQEAEVELREALEIYRSLHDGDHRSVARCLSNLGLALEDQGEYLSAVRLTEQALAMARRLYGEPHLEVAQYLNNLASQHQSSGDFDTAEPLYERAHAIRREILEPSHPDLLETQANLAALRSQKGDDAGAARLLEHVVERCRDDDPELMSHLSNLAVIFKNLGRFEEAKSLLGQSLELRRQRLGEDHPDVARTLSNLAALRVNTGEYDAAEPLYARALEIRRRHYGQDHPAVLLTLCGIARLHRHRDDFATAIPLQEECLGKWIATASEEHLNVALFRTQLAETHAAAGDPGRALELYRQAAEQLRRRNHPRLAEAISGLGAALTLLGQLEEAEATLTEALELQKATLAEGHWRLAQTESRLGGCLAAQGRFEEAEPLLLVGHDRLAERPGGHRHYATRAARARLVDLYRAWGRTAQAARWQEPP